MTAKKFILPALLAFSTIPALSNAAIVRSENAEHSRREFAACEDSRREQVRFAFSEDSRERNETRLATRANREQRDSRPAALDAGDFLNNRLVRHV